MLETIRKIGIFGGTLNPVHHGHLIIAEAVRERFSLDKVLFVPSGNPPHKTNMEVIPAVHRFNMVKCAVETNPFFEASQMEIDRSGYTYSIDTLASLADEYGESAELFFIIGADVVHELVTWKEFRKVFTMCSFIAVMRPGHRKEDFFKCIEELKASYLAQIFTVETPLVDISSTDIRERVRASKSIKYFVPQCVEEYIYENGIYL